MNISEHFSVWFQISSSSLFLWKI